MKDAGDASEESLRRFLEGLRKRIKTGHEVISAPAADRPCMIAYTVGLTELGLPELVVYGLAPTVATMILNGAAEQAKEKGAFEDGAVIENVATVPLMVVACDPLLAFNAMPMVASIYGTPAVGRHMGWRGQQIILPDRDGRWPFDPAVDVDHARSQMPLLGRAPLRH